MKLYAWLILAWLILALLIFSCGAHGAEHEELTEDERGTLFVVRQVIQRCGHDTVHGVGATAVGGVRLLRVACYDQGGVEHRFIFRLWVGSLPTLELHSVERGQEMMR